MRSTQAAQLIDADDFFRDAHRRVFDKMVDLNERGEVIDLVTLKDELERSGDLDGVGGPAYIAGLVDGVPRSTHVEYYAHIVKEKATRRQIIFAANEILQTAYTGEGGADTVLDKAEQAIFRIADDSVHTGFVALHDLVEASHTNIDKLQAGEGAVTGVPSGFVDLDKLTRGFQPSDLVLIAARAVHGQDRSRAEHRASISACTPT